jgi:hypothetical protein
MPSATASVLFLHFASPSAAFMAANVVAGSTREPVPPSLRVLSDKAAAAANEPFGEAELDSALRSMQSVADDGRPAMTAENYATWHSESVDLGAYRGGSVGRWVGAWVGG